MHSTTATTRKMIEYAKQHQLAIPALNRLSPIWGSGKRTLAWRVSGHAFGSRNASAIHTQRLDNFLFPLTFGQKVMRVATSQVGVREYPPASNAGPRVHDYQSVTGAYNAPWCASFVSWCYRKVDPKHPLPPIPAYVPSWAQSNEFKHVAFNDAKAGDFVTLWGNQHIELVAHRDGDYLHCIGGNTSPVGQNNHGGMVARTSRHRSEVTVIGRRK